MQPRSARHPVVVLAHGLAGWRMLSSWLASGTASWGFVVLAPDFLSRGFTAVVSGTAKADPAGDVGVPVGDRVRPHAVGG